MKKLTLLLMPVMPGFEAWAVNGFVERPEKPDSSELKPTAISSDALVQIVGGFTTPAGETVFIAYSALPGFIRRQAEKSIASSIQPLDRGGVLVSFTLTEPEFNRVMAVIGFTDVVDSSIPVSKSKSK